MSRQPSPAVDPSRSRDAAAVAGSIFPQTPTRVLATGQTLRARGRARLLAKVEAALVPPPRKWLRVIIDEGDDEAEAKEKAKALAEHVARHPEYCG